MTSSRLIVDSLTKSSEESLSKEKSHAPETTSNTDTNINNVIDPTQIILNYKICSGGFGKVSKATYQGKAIAVKELHSFTENALNVLKIENEKFKKLETFKLNGVVRYLGYISSEKSPKILMEYVDGCDVHEMIDSQIYKQNTLNWNTRYEILEATVSVCCELHDKNIIHGDLKWENVLYRLTDKTIKLTDFSFSQFLSAEQSYISDKPSGTINFMAPEIITKGKYSLASDVFAMGGLMYDLAGEGKPFNFIKNRAELPRLVKNGKRSPISEHCPKGLARLITWCWEQKPNNRPTMHQLKQEVHALAEEEKSQLRNTSSIRQP